MIPRIIHRIWLSELERPQFLGWRDRLEELHPGWDIRTYHDPDALTWLRFPDLFHELLESDPYGRAPDLLRYELLWRFGGIYLDTDFEPLRPFDELLDDPRPFAAWENDRTMCTAVLAAPPQHPAIGLLLDGVRDRLAQTRRKPANEAIGPEYATAHWRERDDVRRLPPWTFYPVGWWEKQLLGDIEYPAKTFAVHHWSKGWDAKKPQPKTQSLEMPKVSVLVAFRDVDGSRTRLWDFVRERFERELPELELVVATDDGTDPFHKTVALNRAADRATGDVFMITDADTWLDPELIRSGANFVAENPHRWSKPWTFKLKVNAQETEHILKLGEKWNGSVDARFGRPENRNSFSHAPPLIVSRQQFETVGGFDERFRGWGQEDVAFSMSLIRFYGAPKKFAGTTIHLFHPRIGRSGDDLWEGQASNKQNMLLVGEYRRARTAEQMKALIEQRGEHGHRDGVEPARHPANA